MSRMPAAMTSSNSSNAFRIGHPIYPTERLQPEGPASYPAGDGPTAWRCLPGLLRNPGFQATEATAIAQQGASVSFCHGRFRSRTSDGREIAGERRAVVLSLLFETGTPGCALGCADQATHPMVVRLRDLPWQPSSTLSASIGKPLCGLY